MRSIVAVGILGAVVFGLSHPQMWCSWGDGASLQFPGWDLTRVFWADLEFARSAVARGQLPLWNPLDRTGYPFMAEPQSGMFDVLTWVLVLTALVIGYAPSWLIVVKSILLFGIGAAGVAAYLRHRGLPAWAWTWAAVALVLCPRFDKLKDQSALWPAVWVGWLLLASDLWVKRPTWRSALWLGLAIVTVVNAGYPPSAFRLALLVGPYVLVTLAVQIRGETDRRAYLTDAGRSAIVTAVVVVVLCAGQVWCTLQVLGETQRASLDLGSVLASRTGPQHVVGLFGPSTGKQALNLYVSTAGLMGVLAATLRPRPETVVFLGVAVLGFVLGCGDDLPVLPAFAKLPGFRSFRIAGHYLMLTSIGLVLAGAMGLAELGRIASRRRRDRLLVGLVVGIEVVAFFATGADKPWWSTAFVVISGGLVVSFVVRPSVARRVGWALVVLTGLDLGLAARPVAEILQPLPNRRRGYVMAETIGRSFDVRVADYEFDGKRVGPREGIRDFTGHRPALTDPRYLMVYRRASDSVHLLRAMNVGLVGFGPRRGRATRQGYTTRVEGERGLFRVRDPWPLAFFTDVVEVADGPKAAVAVLHSARQPRAVFERADAFDSQPAASSTGAFVAATVLRYDNHRIELEVDAPGEGVLVVNEAYESGWRAWVDGRSVPIRRVNLIARGVEVGAGSHVVVFEYVPVGARALWWLWLLGQAGCVGWLARRRRGNSLQAQALR